MDEKTTPKDTPLTGWHMAHGAKMAQFGGYRMPMEYTGILAEHQAVRRGVGVFDVSHMTEFQVTGRDSSAFLDHLVTHWPSRLTVGQALYTPMCYEDGGTVDDLLIYRLAPDAYMLVANAANHAGDWAWISARAADWGGDLAWRDVSDQVALIAVQGPQASALLTRLTEGDQVAALRSYHFLRDTSVGRRPAQTISRTGYTGEDGFEVYLDPEHAEAVWEAVVEAGATPAGLGARDTLRLEARLPLYGHELAPDIMPLEAGLGPFIQWDKPGGFVGRDAMLTARDAGTARRLVGLRVQGGIARAGAPVGRGDALVGRVTSGSYAPSLEGAVALALVPGGRYPPGTELWCEVRGRRLTAEVVRLPFYRRPAFPEGTGGS